ncbi:MAG: glycine--tRNA ligase subunit beta [Chloroflexi bacterium]|nr:glycine--tRNA ligase subunit beta [Chloroflexota bacterium]
MQDVIMKLHTFWSEHDCVIWHPYNVQVPAGTNNPATLLRVLGPEPWRVGYLEPSIRPDDGRFAENPNRMQQFMQYQVILKPDPGNPQELYLESLKQLGIDPRQHDIRFVEDNWETPALGAWGLGWEVWLDGQEITQFTYFQQAGGLTLDPVSVEITYGLERIVLALQGVDTVWDINLTQGLFYGDMFRQPEVEHCEYYFNIADVDGLRRTYDTYASEHHRALEAGALIPAYDYVLKCSHLFNILDTRGAIGVTERAGYFRRMREMTLSVARAYLAQREEMGFPLIDRMPHWQTDFDIERTFTSVPRAPTVASDFLLEIGVEELPPDDVDAAIDQLTANMQALLTGLRLAHGDIHVMGTPRRLVVHVKELATHQTTVSEEVKGPPKDRAYDADGHPTKAAEGFARKQGVPVEDLQVKSIDNGEDVVAQVEHIGRPVTEVLTMQLPDLVRGLKFDKSMRWNDSRVSFSRPIRWLLALYDDQLLPFEFAGIYSDKVTRGLRPLGSPSQYITNTAAYFEAMQEQGIVLDPEERRRIIQTDADALAEEAGGRIPADPGLLDEVIHLVEQPTVLRGSFDERFLELPREVLVTVMRKHQRYFAVEDANGDLLPYFIAVRNGDREHLDLVTKGNEHVLVARFADARYFYEADTQQPLESYLPRLSTLTFQEKLGSMLDKNQRVHEMVPAFARLFDAAEDVVPVAKRAAHLAKADLATQMVVEFTSLQGVMGQIYARNSGEPEEVAAAIFQHWLPRSADDNLPQGAAGVMLALLDRFDSLVGLFAVGLAPTSSADPFALRRAALGVIQILLDQELELDLREAIDMVAGYQPVPVSAEAKSEVLDFIGGRLRVLIDEQGYPHDITEAVLAEQRHNPVRAREGIKQLQRWTQHEDWENILDTYARCARIVRDKPTFDLHAERFTENVERELFAAYLRVSKSLHPIMHNVDRFLAQFTTLVPPITAFFDEILVMDEDPAIRENRLALLQHIAALAKGRADMSQLQGF